MVWKEFKDSNSKKMGVKCSTDTENEIDNLWQCVTQELPTCTNPASVICQGKTHLNTGVRVLLTYVSISKLR